MAGADSIAPTTGVMTMATDLRVEADNRPGQLATISEDLGKVGVNIEGFCATTHDGMACSRFESRIVRVLGVHDPQRCCWLVTQFTARGSGKLSSARAKYRFTNPRARSASSGSRRGARKARRG